MNDPRVVLVSMPFCTLDRPSISISVLQARLRDAGIHCDTRHFSYLLTRRIRPWDIETLGTFGPQIGEWLFVPALYGGPLVGDEVARYVATLHQWFLWDDPSTDRLLAWRDECTAFLDDCLDAADWSGYDVVGFTSMFEQNLASLALARRLKERHPGLKVLFGGANWRGDMGVALHEMFGFVDAACTGEGDLVIEDLVRRIHRGDDLSAVPGIVYRDDQGRSVSTGAAPLVHDMDALAVPDYSDWLTDRAAAPAMAGRPWKLLFESSRGCWWGQRSHCTFCGLNGEGMAYRLKSPDRLLAELRELRDRFGTHQLVATDTIIDMRYFHNLLPRLAAEEAGSFDLFWETKANLTHDQVRLLAAAGVREIQPGIEHLSDHVLELMGKGTTMMANLQLLKWCREFGIAVRWNFLYGFPGETAEDYRPLPALIDAIGWLQPPATFQCISVQRFSPYHDRPGELGFANVRHDPTYEFIYAGRPEHLDRVAYSFTCEYAVEREPDTYSALAATALQSWIEQGDAGGVWLNHSHDRAVLRDDRASSGRVRQWAFTGWRAVALAAIDRARTVEELRHIDGLGGTADAQLVGFLDWLQRERLAVSQGGRYLGLGVHVPARAEPCDPAARLARRIPVRSLVPA